LEPRDKEELLDVHSLRHTYGSLLLSAGVNPKVVQTLMRHKTFAMTMDLYGHAYNQDIKMGVQSNPLNSGTDLSQPEQ